MLMASVQTRASLRRRLAASSGSPPTSSSGVCFHGLAFCLTPCGMQHTTSTPDTWTSVSLSPGSTPAALCLVCVPNAQNWWHTPKHFDAHSAEGRRQLHCRAHNAGLQVHPYTFRNEPVFFATNLAAAADSPPTIMSECVTVDAVLLRCCLPVCTCDVRATSTAGCAGMSCTSRSLMLMAPLPTMSRARSSTSASAARTRSSPGAR